MHQLDSVASRRNWAGRQRHLLTALLLFIFSPAAWAQLSGTYYVGTNSSPVPARTYASLPAAVTALGAGVSGPVTFQLLDATYSLTAALTLPVVTGASSTNTISIVPASGVSPVISGSVAGAATGLIVLNGTDYLIINGTDGSASGRTISIRNTAAGPAVLLTNDATNVALRYLNLESAASGNIGTVMFGSSATGGTGNDFNSVANCDVRDLSVAPNTVPSNAIYSLGTGAATASVPATTSNSDNTVQNCNIYNFTAGGVFLSDTGNGGNWTISGNNIYQTATRAASGIRGIRVTSGSGHVISNNNIYQQTGTVASVFYGIAVAGGANGATITGNFIGGSAPGATGSAMSFTGTAFVYPMYLSLGTTTPASIQGNTIRAITSAATGTAYAIDLANGSANIGTVTANTFGSTTSGLGITHAGTFYGVHIENASTATIQSNTFAGISTTVGTVVMASGSTPGTLAGVYSSSSAASTVSGNTFTGFSNSLNNTNVNTSVSTSNATPLAGVYVSGSGAVTVTNNTISSLSSSATAAGTFNIPVAGVWLGSAASAPVSGNQITGLSATGTAPVYGVYVNGAAATSISNNTIGTLTNSTTVATQLAAINSVGSGAVVIDGNIISSISQTGLTGNLYGIQSNGVAGSNVTGNQVTGVTYSGTTTGNTVYGISASGSNTISNNTVTTVQATVANKTQLRGIYVGGTGNPTVTGNTVTGVLNSSTGTDVQTIGLYVGSTGTTMTGMTVRGNLISNVGTTNTTATTGNQVITGLQLGLTTAATVERNRIWNVYGNTPGTGTSADAVRGLAFAASPLANFTGTIANNQISLPAGAATQLSYGIFDNSTGGTISYFYNTVYLTGSAATANSYGYFRSTVTATTPAVTAPATVTLRNNILYNERATTGGAAFAIGIAEAGTFNSNYNLFVTPSASVVGSVAGTSYDFAGWKTTTTGDANSYDRRPAALPAATVFTAPATGDLHINPAYFTTASIIESGGTNTGVSITNDYDGDPRFGAAGYAGSGTAPDLGSDEYNATPPANQTFDPNTGTAVTQITDPVAAGGTNQAVIRVALTTAGPANPLTLTQLNFTADGTTANGAVPANISNARVYFTGTNPIFSTTTQFGTGTVAPAFSAAGGFSIAGSQTLGDGVNYFFLTYDVTAGSPSGDVVDGVLTGVQIGSGAVSPIAAATGAPAGNRVILGPMSGNFTVGYDLGTEAFPSLTAAVAALTSRGVATGASVTFTLTNPGATKPYDATTATAVANQETFPIVVPAVPLGTGQTLSIVPAAGVMPLISGSVASASGALLVLDGTDYLSINGYDGSTAARTITIRNVGNGPAVLLRNDATNNALRYLTLESGATGTSGTVLLGTTTGTTGNDDNTIFSCDVRDLSVAPNTVPANGIYSLGTGAASANAPAATANSSLTVQGCNIYNFTNAGVYGNTTGSGNSWTVGGATATLGNAIYQTAGRTTQVIGVRLGSGSGHVVSNNQIYQTSGTVAATYYGISMFDVGDACVVSNNTIGGSATNAGGNPLSVNGTFYGINLRVGTASGALPATSVLGNVVRNVSNATTSAETHGIRIELGLASVSGNTIGDANPTAPAVSLTSARGLFGISAYSALASTISTNTIVGLTNAGTTSGTVVYGIYSNVANSAHTITGNTVSNVQATGLQANLRGIYVGGNGATPVVNDNIISGVINASTGGAASTVGLFVGPTATDAFATLEVRRNRVSNVANTAPAALTGTNAYTTTGLLIGATAAGTVERNRVWNVSGASAGTGANADQVRGLAVQGVANGTFTNNQVSVAPGTTDQLTYGLLDASSGGTTNFYYNSVYLVPASAGAAASYGFYRSAATAAPAGSLRNNIFYNGRTAATGAAAYAIGTASATGWTNTTSNYNLLIGSSAATIGDFGGTAYSFADWKTQTNGDASSLSETSTVVPAASLFTDVTTTATATGNLDVNPANAAAWYANGNGVQLPGQTADYTSATATRSTTVAAGGTDIGSDEFVPTSTPPMLTVSAAPSLGGTQNFSLGGRLLATVTYGSTGTVPTNTSGRYYSGTNPTVATTTTRYTNYYTEIVATGGTNFTYDLVLHYDDALLGSVQTEADQHLLKRNTNGSYEFFPTSVTDVAANTITASALTSFSQFFATDQAQPLPLPVTLTSFDAFRRGSDVELDWNTASEKNNSGYEIQLAIDGLNYRKLGFVRSEVVNSNAPQHYQFFDKENGKQGTRYYRLRQLDLDGKASYSPVQIVTFGESTSPLLVTASPNPFAANLTLTMTLPKPGGTVPLTITDATGRTVYAQSITLPAGSSRLELNQLAALPNGLYVVHVTLAGQTQHLKVVKH